MAEARPFAAHIADCSHCDHSKFLRISIIALSHWEQLRIPDAIFAGIIDLGAGGDILNPMALDARTFRAIVAACVEAMGVHRAEVDAMNVYPVPDADTGTNVYFTVQAGAAALDGFATDTDLAELLPAFSEAILLGARGNSGVILSQLIRAGILASPIGSGPTGLAHALDVGAKAAYAAVGKPQEGTILTVAREAAAGAQKAAENGADLLETWKAATAAARVALAHTPEQLERLAKAGVVDAGGRALLVIYETVERVFTGEIDPQVFEPQPVPIPIIGDDFVDGGPAYEVMYLLRAENVDELRTKLGEIGDSLVVVGGDGLWNVHVHVDDVGAAIEAGIAAGSPYRIRVTHFADQLVRKPKGRIVVVATVGKGLSGLCADSGARVVEFGRDNPLTIERMTEFFKSNQAEEFIVLPNNKRYVAMCEAAANTARDSGARVAVIPTIAQVQAIAALAVHDPGRPFDEDVVAMSSAAAHVDHGAITIATAPAITSGGPCEKGDVLGVVNGDFAIVGKDMNQVAIEVVRRLISSNSELVTLVTGAHTDESTVKSIEDYIRENEHGIDVVVYDGDQENYPLFVAVE